MNDLEISRSIPLRPLVDVARIIGLDGSDLEFYGDAKAKVKLDVLDRPGQPGRTKYIVVTAVSPTPLGEGKTVHTVGLNQALNRIGKRSCCVIRQPSMGPVFGIKGGAAGGGYSQVVPSEEFNMHLTGDFHAVTSANNWLAARMDASLLLDNPLDIDADSISFRRVIDMNDRALRNIDIGLGGPKNGVPRNTGFDITAASEVMAILGLASDLKDLRRRLGRIVIGSNGAGQPVTAEDLSAAGAMAAILKDSIKPTLMQTLEGTPALVHTGPFANIAHGNSSIVADRIAMTGSEYVVTEAGFGADMGAEKFFNIKCRESGMKPDAALLVTTVRAIKVHSGKYLIRPGQPLPAGLDTEDLDAMAAGVGNLEKQIENVKIHGVPVVVAINSFPSDSPAEIEFLRKASLDAGASAAHLSRVFQDGGLGGEDIANAIVEAAEEPSTFRYLYPSEASLEDKIAVLAGRIYGADGVEYSDVAREKLALCEARGYGSFPICMAKTQYSLSHDPKLKGRPTGYQFVISDVRVSVGAGFVCPISGSMVTMPGLGRTPGGTRIDIDERGEIVGLF